MGQDPSAIREEIDETRGRMGDTIEAIGYKTDVKTRAKDNVSGKVDAVKSKLGGATGRVNEATPSAGDVKQGAQRAAGVAQENPIGLAVGGLAVGFLAGMLVPSTRVENEKIGPIADDVKEKARETGQEVVDRGKQVAQQAAESAKETAQEAGREQADQMKSGDGGEETGSTAGPPSTAGTAPTPATGAPVTPGTGGPTPA